MPRPPLRAPRGTGAASSLCRSHPPHAGTAREWWGRRHTLAIFSGLEGWRGVGGGWRSKQSFHFAAFWLNFFQKTAPPKATLRPTLSTGVPVLQAKGELKQMDLARLGNTPLKVPRDSTVKHSSIPHRCPSVLPAPRGPTPPQRGRAWGRKAGTGRYGSRLNESPWFRAEIKGGCCFLGGKLRSGTSVFTRLKWRGDERQSLAGSRCWRGKTTRGAEETKQKAQGFAELLSRRGLA